MRVRLCDVCVGCVAVLSACTDSGDPDGSTPISRGTGSCDPFTSDLIVEDTFAQPSMQFSPGEPVYFNLRITSNSDAQASLLYDGCSSVRTVIYDRRNREIFDNLPEGTACTTIGRPFEYAPRETREFRVEWNQTTSIDGAQVPAGQYTVNLRDRSNECRGDLDRVGTFEILQ